MAALNDTLDEIVTRTESRLDDGHPSLDSKVSTLKYTVLTRLEKKLQLPVVVKYGDAHAVADMYGSLSDPVWKSSFNHADKTLFRIEPDGELSDEDWQRIHETFLAIGAWHIGATEPERGGPVTGPTEAHFLWPNDHPIIDRLSHK